MALFHTTVLDNQIKALPTVDTASGSVASFDTDMTENLVEVKCQIVATQSGSGTPSPSNPRPIGVYDSLTLYHNDINMWDEQWELGSINASGNTQSTSNIRTVGYIKVKPDTTYYIKCPNMIYIWQYDISKTVIGSTATGKINATFTTGATTEYIRFRTDSSYGTTYNNDISINYPDSDQDYHAFNGAYITFGQTVAKGTLNVTTGVLEITHEILTLDGTESVSVTGTATNRRFGFNNILTYNALPLSSHFIEIDSNTSPWGYYRFISGYILLLDVNSQMADETELKTWLANQYSDGTPVQFLCELATPLTIQLSATQITALLNENNIWCDTNGDTEVKYLLTVGKKIS